MWENKMKNQSIKNTKGGNTMKRLLTKIKHNIKGFTLVELLIVVAILGVLTAVVLPNVVGLADEGQVESAKAELVTIQTAMDTMIAKLHLPSVNATATATSDMSAFPPGSGLYPDYLRTPLTKGTYSCSITGLVTQTTTGY
jgi:prepilin-type N-terminal cleavage/methylation domain-containing protein